MTTAMAPRATAPILASVPLDRIDIGANVRSAAGDLDDLTATIREHGVLQPVKVVETAGGYRLVWGQRRVLAARAAGLTDIPAIVVDAESDGADLAAPGARRATEQLLENLIRADLNPIDEAEALAAVLEAAKGLTQADLARQLGRHPSWVANTLALRRAPKKVQELVRTDKLNAAHAKAISGLPPAVQVRLAEQAVEREQSAHSLEESAKWERRSQADTARNGKLTEDAVKRGLAALEKAGTPKDAELYVFAASWQISDPEVRKAIKAAGYKTVDGWAREKRWSKCDCTAIQLQIRDGEGSIITPVCVKAPHQRALEAEANRAQAEKAAAEVAERKRLAAVVFAALPDEMNPTIARLLVRGLDGYSPKAWAEYSKIEDGKLATAIADRLTSERAIRGGYESGGRLPVRTILRLLGAVDEAAPAKPAKVKKAAKA